MSLLQSLSNVACCKASFMGEIPEICQKAKDRIEALEDQVKRCRGFLANLPHQGPLEGPTAFMIRQCGDLLKDGE